MTSESAPAKRLTPGELVALVRSRSPYRISLEAAIAPIEAQQGPVADGVQRPPAAVVTGMIRGLTAEFDAVLQQLARDLQYPVMVEQNLNTVSDAASKTQKDQPAPGQ